MALPSVTSLLTMLLAVRAGLCDEVYHVKASNIALLNNASRIEYEVRGTW